MLTTNQHRWGMVVDLNRCVGCQTCTIACKHANDTPPGVQWRRVLDVERGEFPDVERLFMVVGCQHCAEPPCVPVCPTGATRQRADGLVTMDYDTCIGCAYCAVSCPYQARTIVHDREWYFGEETPQEAKVFHDERIGVASKCTFCVERVDEGLQEGRQPGIDPAYTPACSAACIAQAIHFGDFNNTESNVSQLAQQNKYFQMHSELGTDPQIKYLYEIPAATPGREEETGGTAPTDDDPLAGSRQSFWDLRAAANFILGGMTSSLVIVATIAYYFAGLSEHTLLLLNALAGAGMGIGLLCVLMKIGRKMRFLRVLLRPQTSWMTRETYAVAVFYPVLAADLLWPHPILHLLTALAALAFLYCQARILHMARGIPAWRVDLVPGMLVMAGLLEGVGLLAIATALAPEALNTPFWLISAAGIILTLANALLWQRYISRAAENGLPISSREELLRFTPSLRLIGHLAPLVLFPLAPGFGPVALGVAGVAAVAGGVIWKFCLILRACHQQGFALPKIPQRGSGKRAAPPRLEGMA